MKKVYKYIPYILIIVSLLFVYDLYFKNKVFREQISDLRHEKDSIDSIISDNDKTILNLTKMLNKANIDYKNIYNKLKQQQDETDNVSDTVISYDEQQLDSIITNYKHIIRPKD